MRQVAGLRSSVYLRLKGETAEMVSMNTEAIEYIRDKMGFEDVVIQVETFTT